MTAGLPLTIELATSWLKGLTASQSAFEMQRNHNFLSTTTRNVEERHNPQIADQLVIGVGTVKTMS